MILDKVKIIILGTPRTFYGPEKFYKNYSEEDSKAF